MIPQQINKRWVVETKYFKAGGYIGTTTKINYKVLATKTKLCGTRIKKLDKQGKNKHINENKDVAEGEKNFGE